MVVLYLYTFDCVQWKKVYQCYMVYVGSVPFVVLCMLYADIRHAYLSNNKLNFVKFTYLKGQKGDHKNSNANIHTHATS